MHKEKNLFMALCVHVDIFVFSWVLLISYTVKMDHSDDQSNDQMMVDGGKGEASQFNDPRP